MNDRVYGRLTFLTTWPAVGLLVVLFLLCRFGFDKRDEALGCGNETLDGQRWYTPEKAHDLLGRLGPRGRCLYAVTAVTLDLFFPAVYAGLFAGLIGNLYPVRWARRLAAIPAGAAVADWCENGLVAYLARTFDEARTDPVGGIAAVATALKTGLFLLAMCCVVAGCGRSIRSALGQDAAGNRRAP